MDNVMTAGRLSAMKREMKWEIKMTFQGKVD